jgi:protein disulfide-isomerase A6
MGIKGFPTLKVVKPSRKGPGMPTIEDYEGERTAKAIVDTVIQKIPNHVKRVMDKSLEDWLKGGNETAKAILFSEKSTTSALLRALAIDYLGTINFGQINKKESVSVETFGIEKFPALVLLPGGEKESLKYDGDLKKDPMSEFLKQVATPNPDPAPQPPKKKSKKKAKASEEEKPMDSKVKAEKEKESADTETPIKAPQREVAVIPTINEENLKKACLTSDSKICALILAPAVSDKPTDLPEVVKAMKSLTEVYDKHSKRRSSFPFYVIEATNPTSKTLRDTLGLKDTSELEVIAINAKRMWWRKYTGDSYGHDAVELWIDAIRMNEGKREKLPETLVTQAPAEDEEKNAQPPNNEGDGKGKETKENVRDEL